eukprot:gb/GECG01012551.1/.p1 GENE.gb/GECG01012551.1/~~gb/GECG01012551.1/.p1  ORF type:complete len:323 (+),score=37.83 gb/GECG01012551.1/:1-969(+)
MANDEDLPQQANDGPKRGSAIQRFLSDWQCHDLIPESTKVLVFDVDIPMQLAFYAFVEHGVFAAPLWDSLNGKFAGMLTTSDFICLIYFFRLHGNAVEALATLSIRTWHNTVNSAVDSESKSNLSEADQAIVRSFRDRAGINVPVSVSGEDSLLLACKLLSKYQLHRLPVLDPEASMVIGVLTHKAVIQHIVEHFVDDTALYKMSPVEAGVGTFSCVQTITYQTKLADVLEKLARQNVSAVPIIDKDGVVVDIYTREDVMFLATDTELEGLEQQVSEAKKIQGNITDGRTELVTCFSDEPLRDIIMSFGRTGVSASVTTIWN